LKSIVRVNNLVARKDLKVRAIADWQETSRQGSEVGKEAERKQIKGER
jgi:hypothetical protein